MMPPVSPYVAGNPVGDSPAFVGRADVLRDVLRVLRRPQDNAVVLYGQRRIGKTSILQHLAAWLYRSGPFRPVYFDLQDKAAWPLDRVLQELARTIAAALDQPEPDLGSDPATVFRQAWLPSVLDGLPEGCSLVLLFDEFDVLAAPSAEQAAAAFFPYLRDLLDSDRGRLQFVFVIGRNVDDLDNIALSLFKGTAARRVSLLSREDTANLVCLSESNGTLSWTDEAVEQVWALTCGHPFLTQQLCSHIWEQAYDEEPDEPTAVLEDVNRAIAGALEASRNTLEWLWDGLPPAERIMASALAEAGPEPINQEGLEPLLHESGVRVVIRELQFAPELLQEWDLIKPVDVGYCFRVELLRQWIVEHKPLSRVREELDRIEPIAESLYRAGLGYYRNEQFDQAIGQLRQAVGLNPNHVRANQLLADILLAQGHPNKAQQLLERLFEYQPAAARPRLVQALLAQAQAADFSDEHLTFLARILRWHRVSEDMGRVRDQQLALYERVLELDSIQPQAVAGRERIWEQRGDAALKDNDLETALEAYHEAGLTAREAEVAREIRRRKLDAQLTKSEVLEQEGHYQKALELSEWLAAEYSEMTDLAPDLGRLKRKIDLMGPYRRALEALRSGDRQTAQNVLAQEVISSDPEFEEATRYLHLAVTGTDVSKLLARIRGMRLMMVGVFVAGVLLGIAIWQGGDIRYSALFPDPVQTPVSSSEGAVIVSLTQTLEPEETRTVEPTTILVSPTPTQLIPTSTPTTVPTVDPGLWGLHEVCAGETLSEIALEYGVSVDYFTEINLISDPNQLATGRLLLVPRTGTPSEMPHFIPYQVVSGDTLTSLAETFNTSVAAIQVVNGLTSPDLISPGDDLRIPVGWVQIPRSNDCEFFAGRLEHPDGLNVYLRSRPAFETREPSLVVVNRTSLQILGQNPGVSGGPWYKIVVDYGAEGSRVGWLPSMWVRLANGLSPQDIPVIEQ